MDIEKNIRFGKKSEKEVLPIINKYFGKTFKFKNRYSRCDYKCGKRLVELKSRRCSFECYKKTMIGNGKIDFMRGKLLGGYKCYFIFRFTKGLFIFRVKNKTINLIERGITNSFIPTNLLIKISDM